VLAGTLAWLALTGCGGSGAGTASGGATGAATTAGASTTIESNFSTHNNDRDNDGDHNNDDGWILHYGHTANPSDRRTSVALLKRYFAAAAAKDGATGCSSLVPFIAASVVENDGHSAGLIGKTCAVVMTKLFKMHHKLLAEKNATLRVMDVRVLGDKALAILDFPAIPEMRQIAERRVGNTWKLLDLLDGILE
jgi:hypothetical protein